MENIQFSKINACKNKLCGPEQTENESTISHLSFKPGL